MKSFTLKEKNGFTILELIAVIVIIGIVSGISLPIFLNVRNHEDLNSASKSTVAWLDDLRRMAIQKSVPCTAEWNITEGIINGKCGNETSLLNINAESIKKGQQITITLKSESNQGAEQVLNGASDSGADIDCTDAGPDSLCTTTWFFTPRGTSLTQAEAIFTLPESNQGSRCIKITSPLGLIRSAKREATDQEDDYQCDYTTSF